MDGSGGGLGRFDISKAVARQPQIFKTFMKLQQKDDSDEPALTAEEVFEGASEESISTFVAAQQARRVNGTSNLTSVPWYRRLRRR